MSAPVREPFHSVTSAALVIARNDVDTDQIIPARFLKTINRAGLGEQLFFDWRYRLPDGTAIPFSIDAFARRMILDGTDELGYILAHEPELAAYEAAHPPRISTLA